MNEMHFTGYRKAETWAELGLIGDRLSFTDDEVITKLGLGYVSSQGYECAMDTAIRYELLNAGQDGEISAKQMLNPRTKLAALIEAGIVADGWYKNDDDERERAWVYDERFIKLHRNKITSHYYRSGTHFAASLLEVEGEYGFFNKAGIRAVDSNSRWWYGELLESFTAPLQTKPVLGNERMLSNVMEDKIVLRYINKALNRMVKSEKAIQVTKGRGRTFRWNAWEWLDGWRNRHLVSESKKRKVGDTVNGWVYTQGDTVTTYGVDVHQHWWQPVETPKLYFVQFLTRNVKVPFWSGYNSELIWDSTTLPFFFTNEEDAQLLCEQMNAQLSCRVEPSNYMIKHIDEDWNITTDDPQFTVGFEEYKYRVDKEAVIEDYEEPLAAHLSLMTKGFDNYKQMSKLYDDYPQYMMYMDKTEKKGVDE